MEQYAEVVLDLAGNAVPGASVQVLVGSVNGSPATIYDAGGTPQQNPIPTGVRGDFAFQAANGKYVLRVLVNGAPMAVVGPLTLYDPNDDTRFSSLDTSLRPDINALGIRTNTVEQSVTSVQAKLQERPTFTDKGATSAGDATSALQAAFNVGYGFAADSSYSISAPLKLPSMSYLCGTRAGIAFTGAVSNVKRAIKKTTNTAVAVVNFQSGASSNIDCIIYTDPAWIDAGVSYPQKSTIERLSLQGRVSVPNFAGVYIEQGSGFTLRDMQISHVVHALYAKECWSSVVENIQTTGKIVWLGGTSITFTNIGTGAGEGTNGGYSFSSLIYSTMNSCWADGATDTAYRFLNSKLTLNSCGCENATAGSANSGTAIAFDGGCEIGLNGFNVVPRANQVLPIFTAGFDNTATFNQGCSGFGVAGVNCPDIYVWGNGSTVIFNDYTFVNGSKNNPVVQFATGITTSKVIVRTGTEEKIYTSTGSANTVVESVNDAGTFTPSLTFGGAAVGMAYGTRTGTWQKRGKNITISGRIALTAKGSSTGVAVLSGWPAFTPLGDVPVAFALVTGITGGPVVGTVDIGSAQAVLSARTATGDASMADGNFSDTTLLRFTISFTIA